MMLARLQMLVRDKPGYESQFEWPNCNNDYGRREGHLGRAMNPAFPEGAGKAKSNACPLSSHDKY